MHKYANRPYNLGLIAQLVRAKLQQKEMPRLCHSLMNRLTQRRLLWLVSVTLMLVPTLKVATAARDALSNDSPPLELKRFASTVGIWDTITRSKDSPDAPPSERRSVETVRWSANHQFLITDQSGLTPSGRKNRLVITTWNASDREYKLIEVSPIGKTVEMTMLVDGNIRHVLSYRPLDGRLIRTELTVEIVSASESKFRWECTDEGNTWICGEGTSRKR